MSYELGDLASPTVWDVSDDNEVRRLFINLLRDNLGPQF